MACPISQDEINKLKMFIQFASAQPQILNMPQLSFFKDFVESLGGKVPTGNFESPKAEAKAEATSTAPPPEPVPEESDPESEIELELLDTIVTPDNDSESQEMGDDSKEATEEEMDQANDLRSKAARAYSNGEYEEAVNCYTEAIMLNPTSAMFYAKRGQAFLKLSKPNACIRDCNKALTLNPDSAPGYKFRGRAHRLLGNWEEAAKDLRQACKLDFDDEADEWLKEVTPNAKKIEQHKIKQERKKAEKDLQDRKERVRRAQEANKRAAEENAKQADDEGLGGMGGLPPDFIEAFSDPEVSAALQDVMSNPGNIMKYANNPKVMNLLKKFSGGMGGMPGGMGGMPGGMGGMPGFPGMGGMGGMPGGMGGFPGFGAGPEGDAPKPDAKPKPQEFDDGLD